MDKKILGTLIAVFALLIIGAVDVNAAACTTTSCTPVCGWVYPTPDGMELGRDTTKWNTTMVAAVEETTTSTYANVTRYVITPYHNSSSTLNSSEMETATTSSVIFDNLDDGDYKLTATIFYENASANGYNLTATQVSCGSRDFRVNTRTGSVNYPELLETAKDPIGKQGLLIFAAIIVIVGIAWAAEKGKK